MFNSCINCWAPLQPEDGHRECPSCLGVEHLRQGLTELACADCMCLSMAARTARLAIVGPLLDAPLVSGGQAAGTTEREVSALHCLLACAHGRTPGVAPPPPGPAVPPPTPSPPLVGPLMSGGGGWVITTDAFLEGWGAVWQCYWWPLGVQGECGSRSYCSCWTETPGSLPDGCPLRSQALKFLHDKGFPYGHLHASNVLIEDNTCKLLDIENSLLGLPSYYRPYVTQFRKINLTEAIDVYSFGHLLFEMTYGRPPDAVPMDQLPPAPFTSVVSVLQSILSTEACKTGMPTVTQLLQTPLFKDVLLFNSEKAQFKITTKLKEALKMAKDSLEKRLQEEQKTIHQHRRLTRAQSHHGSEEEKKKRKILARKKSRQSTYENEEDFLVKYSNNSGSGASSPPTCPSSPTPPSTSGGPDRPPPPPPPPTPSTVLSSCDSGPPPLAPPATCGPGRTALLSSIQSFSKGKLKKSETNDRSNPLI
ncbi:hypothetical protein ACEWY4_013929 [Coilia grayii]|uniref:WH2 domain-containing protein n=1 Tax=Coilia grayii TaxID=363190 RepID=A0ABD1JXV3_9TELE